MENRALCMLCTVWSALGWPQFEFVGGGWSQHDEALPDLASIVDQMTEGHQVT